jgi:WD40 repeat protein
VTANFDAAVKLWDVASGAELRTLTGHSGPVSAVAFSPDGRTIASGSWDKTFKLWETATGRLLATFFGDAGDQLGRAVDLPVVPEAGIALWAAFTPDNLFMSSGYPKDMFALVRGTELLPLDDFVAANRRESLVEILNVAK